MEQSRIHGVHGEGRILCLNCAGRIYGTSLEEYIKVGDLQTLEEADRGPFCEKGLLCDECSQWIFPPEGLAAAWWREEPEVQEHQRLLLPFAGCLEPLGVDVSNLREVAAV